MPRLLEPTLTLRGGARVGGVDTGMRLPPQSPGYLAGSGGDGEGWAGGLKAPTPSRPGQASAGGHSRRSGRALPSRCLLQLGEPEAPGLPDPEPPCPAGPGARV